MAKAGVLWAIVILCVLHAQAQQQKTDFKGTLEKKGFKLAAALFDIANMTNALNKPAAVYTVLVPNDLAVQNFLKRMNLTLDQLKARPTLAKQLAAQHLIMKHNLRPEDIFDNGPVRIVKTLAGKPNDLLFRKVNGNVKVTDVQGYVANVKNYTVIDNSKTLLPVDKVLLPDSVFYDLRHLCEFRPLTLKEFCNVVVYSGLNSTLAPRDKEVTMFIPNNKAFAKLRLGEAKPLTPAQISEVVRYHVVPGIKTVGSVNVLPSSMKDGVGQPTLLANKNLSVTYTAAKPAPGSKRKLPYAKAEVVTSSGQKVPIIKANVHIGQAVAHGISSILLPGNVTTAAAAAAKHSGRRLVSSFAMEAMDGFTLPSRSLLGWGWGFSAGPTAEMDDAEGAIEAAADGDESVAAADQQSLYGAQTLSVPGAYEEVEEGVLPW